MHKDRVINFPNRKSAPAPTTDEQEVVELKIPKRPSFVPKKYAVEWAEMAIELMSRKRWSNSMLPVMEAAMVARIVFDEATDIMEKLEAQKAIFKWYRVLDLLPKREPGQPGRPRKTVADDAPPQEGLPPGASPRWG